VPIGQWQGSNAQVPMPRSARWPADRATVTVQRPVTYVAVDQSSNAPPVGLAQVPPCPHLMLAPGKKSWPALTVHIQQHIVPVPAQDTVGV